MLYIIHYNYMYNVYILSQRDEKHFREKTMNICTMQACGQSLDLQYKDINCN